MIKFVQKLFGGDSNDRDLKKLWPIVEEINEQVPAIQRLSDTELQAKTDEFKQRVKDAVADIEARQVEIREELRKGVSESPVGGDGQTGATAPLSLDEWQQLSDELDELDEEWVDVAEDTLDAMLPEAFAVVKVACERLRGRTWEAGGAKVTWDMVPYDVQLLGGVVLHQGRVAEMKTGEGKTLVAVAPVYLNALAGRGVHLVTVNPYLAQRDSEWMGPVFDFLGLSVDVIDKYDAHSDGRRDAYRADITYGTNNEFGFDYLRDHSFVNEPEHLVQRKHFYAIVDEVDSVLIDEARTPLIISGPVPQSNDSRFDELKPPVDGLVRAQQKIVAKFVGDAERLLKERDAATRSWRKQKSQRTGKRSRSCVIACTAWLPKKQKATKTTFRTRPRTASSENRVFLLAGKRQKYALR